MKEMGYPYYGPGWVPIPVCETKKGLSHFLKAMSLAVILMLISGLVLGIVFRDISGFEDVQNEEDITDMMGSIIVLAISGIIMLIAGIAALILGIMGLVEIHKGKTEFGPAHEASVKLAVIFLILAIVISLISGGVAVALALGSIDLTSQDPGNVFGAQDAVTEAGVISGVIGIVSAVFQYLFLVYLVKEISRPEKRGMLWAGFGLGVASSVASLIITIMILNGWVFTATNSLETTVYTSLIPTIISVLAIIIFIICFRDALARIESGELKPVPAPMHIPGYGYMPPPPPPVWPQ
ncbi:MAG: hypothetical protein R6W91_00890 [Thermoplasmata archaeon]